MSNEKCVFIARSFLRKTRNVVYSKISKNDLTLGSYFQVKKHVENNSFFFLKIFHFHKNKSRGCDECSGRRRPDVSRIARQFEADLSSGPASHSGGQDQGNHQFHRTSQAQNWRAPIEHSSLGGTPQEEQARQHLHAGEERLCKLRQEASRMAEEIPPTALVDFEAELAQLRFSVHELQRERDELRAQLHSNARSEEREGKQPRNLTSSTLELAGLSVACGQNEIPGQRIRERWQIF